MHTITVLERREELWALALLAIVVAASLIDLGIGMLATLGTHALKAIRRAEKERRAMNLNVSRVGEPRLVSGPNNWSMKAPNEYKVDTTPLAAGPRGYNWFMIFNEQLRGPLLALHDRNRIITVYCDPHEYPNWLGLVDAAIEHANEKEGAIPYRA
jgi:hypothetical protein